MSLKIQYNKTYIQYLQRQLDMRVKALPTLKSKETALRKEVQELTRLKAKLSDVTTAAKNEFLKVGNLIYQFPMVLTVKEIETKLKNIAGVKVKQKVAIHYQWQDIAFIQQNVNLLWALDRLQKWIEAEVDFELLSEQIDLLETARKKTTQKVNLYEKVQIPEYSEGIIKIKRFLEDQENLEKAAIKIIKNKQTREAG